MYKRQYPSNPPSYALSAETAARIVNIVKNDNPNLMIITDDVYGTFIPHFRSLMAELPHNTLCVYSFSKYFGATGWRNAVIALHEDNIYDKMIARLSEEQKEILNKRYSSLDLHPEKMKFIDRMVADSRQICLLYTSSVIDNYIFDVELEIIYRTVYFRIGGERILSLCNTNRIMSDSHLLNQFDTVACDTAVRDHTSPINMGSHFFDLLLYAIFLLIRKSQWLGRIVRCV